MTTPTPRSLLLLCSFLAALPGTFGQCVSPADFISPDTTCQGYPVTFSTTSPGNTFTWNFCTGNVLSVPTVKGMGDPGMHLQTPYYVHVVRDSNLFYSFVTSSLSGEVIRYYHGAHLAGYVLSTENLGSFGVLDTYIRGVCSGRDNGQWYLFVVDGSRLLRLDFGTSLMNDPVPEVFTFPQFSLPEKILIAEDDGEWVGFVTNLAPGKLFRLRFGNSLANVPVLDDLSSSVFLYSPCGFDVKEQDGNWYLIACNRYNGSISRVVFGNSLLNTPYSEFLTAGSFLNENVDVALTLDCERTHAVVTNHIQSGFFLSSLRFPQGLGGPVTLGPIITDSSAALNLPYGLSGIFRIRDSLYLIAVSTGSSQLTRITFPGCQESSVVTWVGRNPPPVTYTAPGSYNIILVIDEGTPNEQITCKNIVILPATPVSLGSDRTVCRGDTLWLDPGPGFAGYLWSNGDTDRLFPVTDSGHYWVEVTNEWDCKGRDTVHIGVRDTYLVRTDTTICRGLHYWAQQAWQSESGIYLDTMETIAGCDSILETNLLVEVCALHLWIPTAFTPNGDRLNDLFHPVAQNILEYRMVIFDRWGRVVFESNSIDQCWDGTYLGEPCQAGHYAYLLFFQTYDNLGQTQTRTGMVLLVR